MDSEQRQVIEEFARKIREYENVSNVFVDGMGGGRIQHGGRGNSCRVTSFYIDQDGDFRTEELSPPSPRHNGAW